MLPIWNQASRQRQHLIRGIATLFKKPGIVQCSQATYVKTFCTADLYKYTNRPIPPPQLKRLEGKVAVITGAASGIGETAARLFVAHGARTVIADIQDERGKKLAEELGDGAVFVHCDVTKEEDVAVTLDAALALEGRVDIAYCNAGILGAIGPIDEMRMKEFDYTLGVNLRGSVLTVKHSARVMKPARKGSIICTGSVTSVVGGLGPHSYSISKSAIAGLVRSTSVELRAYGIRVNMVSPDGVGTPLFVNAFETLEELNCTPELLQKKLKDMSVLSGRYLDSVDVANAALFLASDDAGYISSHNLLVDCGNSVTKATETARWYTTYLPMFREAGKTGLD